MSNNIVYINTKTDQPASILYTISETQGVITAQNIIRKWFNEYNEFLFNMDTQEVVMYKKAYSGYWEANQNHLVKLKI